MGSGSWRMCHDSIKQLGHQSELESIVSTAFWAIQLSFCHTFSAIAEILVFPFCTALLCSLIRQARAEWPDWPMHTSLQTLHGILYTFPLCSLAGMWSLGLTKIRYSVVLGLNLTWTLNFCKLLFTGLERAWTQGSVVNSGFLNYLSTSLSVCCDGGSRRGGADWWMNHLGSLVSYTNALTINNIISGRWTGNVQSLYIIRSM